MENLIIDMDEKIYKNIISNKDALLFINFWAPWSGPCNGFRTHFQSMAYKNSLNEITESQRHIYFARVNVDMEGELVRIFDIKTVPTFIGVKNEDVIFSVQGIPAQEEFEQKIKLLLQA